MKALLIGIGAAGNKAVLTALEQGVVDPEDTMIVNSTSKDFPPEYTGRKVVISPQNGGCGKERHIAKDYALTAVAAKMFDVPNILKYNSVVICTSVEGGTGSGATPVIADYYSFVTKRNVHIIAFTGFEDDLRGIKNTLSFFRDISKGKFIIQTISNASFEKIANGNRFKAEKLANLEMCKRFAFLTGQGLMDSEQNIDDTEVAKTSNTIGYLTIEQGFIEKPLLNHDDYENLVKKMIYESKSIKCKKPSAIRLNVILNISSETEDAIDYSFKSIKQAYGFPAESFIHKQYDGEQEYIAIVASGMKLPIDEMEALRDRCKAEDSKIDKSEDTFSSEMDDILDSIDDDGKYNMIKPVESGTASIDDFMDRYKTK